MKLIRKIRSVLIIMIFYFIHETSSYKIYTVDDDHVCNKSIYLDHGPNSAAILKLTSQENYSFLPIYCTISFKVPIHNWSGLTGVLENVDLRVYEDNSHHQGQPFCVDHIKIVTGKSNPSPVIEEQCGSWSVTPGQPLSKFGHKRALVGFCPHNSKWLDLEDCHVTEIKVIVSIGREKHEHLWKNRTWKPHRGFTFVVTAYSYPIKNGETECRDGLKSCSRANTPASLLGVQHCVHDSLWCDGHVNCGLLENMDEIACFRNGLWGGLVTVVIGPWMGTSILLLLGFCGLLYWRSSRLRITRSSNQPNNQDMNSYAESYELSSNVSSAHHMAIQVRVVCNSNHSHGHGSRHQPWKTDLPPSYDTLFPQGPPQATSSIATSSNINNPGQSLTASIVTTVAGNSISSTSSLGLNSPNATEGEQSSGTVETSLPPGSNRNSLQLPLAGSSRIVNEASSESSIDATITDSSANVTLSVSPHHKITLRTKSFDNSQSLLKTHSRERVRSQELVTPETNLICDSPGTIRSPITDTSRESPPVMTILNDCAREEQGVNELEGPTIEKS